MRLPRSEWRAFLACLCVVQIGITAANPQQAYYNYPSGQLRPLNGGQLSCGDCPAGTQREATNGPYCGRCLPSTQSCGPGYFQVNNQCQACPCPGTNGERRFGTSCRVDYDGQVTCDCPSEYTGRDCSQCAPGTIQNNQYPYNCMRPNSTNSFSVTCPGGNQCNPPQIPKILQTTPICPYTGQPLSNGCPYVNQTGLCPVSGGCPGNTNCPNPCGTCPTNNCQPNSGCPAIQPVPCPTPRPPVIIPPWTPPPPPVCPGPIPCPPPPPPPPPVCPPPPSCPVNPPCPINPPPPPPTPCPSPCPNPCSTCPTIPACPSCELQCPSCPITQPCQTCQTGPCNMCADPCQPCPNPCTQCPNMTCNCPPCEISLVVEPCICDPRGTERQIGNQCICKVNAQGSRCDQCKPGYFGLSSSRPEGCIACFCSGLSTSCSLTPHYRTILRTDRTASCSIEMTDEMHTIVYSSSTSGLTWDGNEATLIKSANNRLFWSLPACLKGDRVTSYGGYLSFNRRCSGSGNSLGPDHEVILVSSSGATVFWTTFEPQKCDGQWRNIEVLLAEIAYWNSWKGDEYRRATRADIMEVLADLQLILVRATFTPSTMSTSISNVSLSTITDSTTQEGIALLIESCRCPTGYRGPSCEGCAPGYYRDIMDMSRSVFGACKPCPCGKTAEGCHLSAGQVICKCRPGFSGTTCQDREVITITCDPFRIREVEGANVDFTCSFTTNSKRRLLLRLGMEGALEKANDTRSLTKTIRLERGLRRVACEVVDDKGITWATVYCAIELVPITNITLPPPPRLIVLLPNETFICVDEGERVSMICDIHYYGQYRLEDKIEWRREGDSKVTGRGKTYVINNARPYNSGTYICSVSDGDVTGAGQISLMVRRVNFANNTYSPLGQQYPINGTGPLEINFHKRHGGDYPRHPYQADDSGNPQADAPDVDGNEQGSSGIIGPLASGHPKAVVSPTVVTAKPGDTVILRCNATGQEPLKFYWKSGSSDYIPTHVRISHGALIFRTFRSQDAGVYYCVAWNHVGQSTAKAVIQVDNSVQTVTPAPSIPIDEGPLMVEILHAEIFAKPGENVNFQCRSNHSSVKYVWTRVGDKMPDSSETQPDGLLTLYRVSDNDKGAYLCTVTNTQTGAKTVSQAILKLKPMGELLVPPRVTIKPKSPLRVRTGERVRLECESVGSPLPNVTWVRSIDGTEKKLISSPTNQASYEITQMTANDVGKYMCTAVNGVGRKSESLSLVIDDGRQCRDNQFRCKSGDQCIPREDRCDSEKDCRDGSDEENCKGNGRRVRRQTKKW